MDSVKIISSSNQSKISIQFSAILFIISFSQNEWSPMSHSTKPFFLEYKNISKRFLNKDILVDILIHNVSDKIWENNNRLSSIGRWLQQCIC